MENYRLPKNLQEKQEQEEDVTGAGQAYKDQEMANKYSLEKGQDLFAPLPDDNSEDDDKKEAKQKRKEERQRKRDEKEQRRREKQRRKSEKEEKKREKRARKMSRRKDSDKAEDDGEPRHSKKRRYDSDDSRS